MALYVPYANHCTSLQTDNHASTPPLSFLQAGCPTYCPTNGIKAPTCFKTQVTYNFPPKVWIIWRNKIQVNSWVKQIRLEKSHYDCVCGCSDIRHLKETRRHFEKISADMDSALVRNAQAARSKVQECDDAHNYLTAMTSGFYHTALDYVFQVSLIMPTGVFAHTCLFVCIFDCMSVT